MKTFVEINTPCCAETLKITTQDFVCIAQTVTEALVETKDAEVHADASALLHMHIFRH